MRFFYVFIDEELDGFGDRASGTGNLPNGLGRDRQRRERLDRLDQAGHIDRYPRNRKSHAGIRSWDYRRCLRCLHDRVHFQQPCQRLGGCGRWSHWRYLRFWNRRFDDRSFCQRQSHSWNWDRLDKRFKAIYQWSWRRQVRPGRRRLPNGIFLGRHRRARIVWFVLGVP